MPDVRLPALVLAFALASGCFGRGGDANEERASPLEAIVGPSAEELARTPGSIRGLVHDEAFAPIYEAVIMAPRLGAVTMTDMAGFFLLEGLEAGTHLLTVSAEGFATRSVTVAAVNGTTLEVDVGLERAPTFEPYVESREIAGFLACSVVTPQGTHDCASADPNHRDVFEFEISGRGRSAVLELVWDPDDAPAASGLELAAETAGYGAQDAELGVATGDGYARIDVPAAILEKYYPEGGLMRSTVALATGDAQVAAAAQLTFTLYVTVFYHEAGPEGFSVLAQP